MKGYIHNQAVGFDIFDSEGKILRKAIYDPEKLPQDISKEKLLQSGYQSIKCRFKEEEKEFIVNVLSRNLIVINGVPFYSSSGTSDDYSVISPAWRKNVWMPFMGYEVQGKVLGRISKLGDKVSKSFEEFAKKLVNDWVKNVSDEELCLIWKEKHRSEFSRGATLVDLITQIMRFGAIEAFSLSMQLLPDDVWAGKEDNGEDFTVFRSLRDYYLKNFSATYSKLSERQLADVKNISFEVINENYHVVECDENMQYRLMGRDFNFIKEPERQKQVQREIREEAHALNRKLCELGANVRYVACLNKPEAPIPNTLAANIAALLVNFDPTLTPEDVKTTPDQRIDIIVDNLLPLEQDVDVEKQKEQYKKIFDKMLPVREELKDCQNMKDISRTLSKLDSLDGLNKESAKAISEEIIYPIYQQYLSSLKQLTTECKKHIGAHKPAHAVLIKLIELLDMPAQTPKERIELFFKHLLDDNSANLKLLKNDNSKDMIKFIKGIGIISAIIFTGIIPGLVISAAVYGATRHSVFDFFKPTGKEFSDKVEEIKNKI